MTDFPGRNLSLLKFPGHCAAMVTLSLEALSKQAPDVTFIHDHPGTVKSGIGREATVVLWVVGKVVPAIMSLLGREISSDVCGERHLFLATSARYAPASSELSASGVPVLAGDEIALGSDGKPGSGVYIPDDTCESAGSKVVVLLEGMRKEGVPETLWRHTELEYCRVLGGTSS